MNARPNGSISRLFIEPPIGALPPPFGGLTSVEQGSVEQGSIGLAAAVNTTLPTPQGRETHHPCYFSPFRAQARWIERN